MVPFALNASFHFTFHNEHILFVTRLFAARYYMPSDLNVNFRTPVEKFKIKFTFRIHLSIIFQWIHPEKVLFQRFLVPFLMKLVFWKFSPVSHIVWFQIFTAWIISESKFTIWQSWSNKLKLRLTSINPWIMTRKVHLELDLYLIETINRFKYDLSMISRPIRRSSFGPLVFSTTKWFLPDSERLFCFFLNSNTLVKQQKNISKSIYFYLIICSDETVFRKHESWSISLKWGFK